MSFTGVLKTEEQAKQLLAAMYRNHAVGPLRAGIEMLVTLRPAKRRDETNAHFHALISQIAKHIGGDLEDPDDAKRILLSAFRIDTLRDEVLGQEWARFGDLRIGRGLRGETVLLGNQTRDLTERLARAFVTWLEAFGATHGVVFMAPKSWEQYR